VADLPAGAGRADRRAGERPYYVDWLGALEDVLAVAADVDARASALAHRPAGHDHGHGHGHGSGGDAHHHDHPR